MVLPDHPTPIVRRTHTKDPVPYLIWKKEQPCEGANVFSEAAAAAKEQYLAHGYDLMRTFL